MGGALTEWLARDLAGLAELDALMIFELASEGLVAWTVVRDLNGIPRAQSKTPVRWSALFDNGDVKHDDLRRIARPAGSISRIAYVETSSDERAAEAYRLLCSAEPSVPSFKSVAPIDDVLREVITRDPLTRWYELAVLRQGPSGRAVFGTYRLFPPGATSGDRQPFAVRCARSDGKGTAFATVAAKSRQLGFQVLSVQSAKVPPGSYRLIAELVRPGVVRFHGLPVALTNDDRSWLDLTSSVPSRLEPVAPTHLVCLIEVHGTKEECDERIGRAERLIEAVVEGFDGELNVSVISYGAHSVLYGVPDETVRVHVWAKGWAEANASLARLRKVEIDETRYTRAAQIECALAEVSGKLTSDKGRPVVVTIGKRPPFPPRVDTSEVIPCPKRHDWRAHLRRISQHQGATLGAIHNEGLDPLLWAQLGRDALSQMETFYAERFAADLCLAGSTFASVPFPILEEETS